LTKKIDERVENVLVDAEMGGNNEEYLTIVMIPINRFWNKM
jgi:hypothetical protein